MSISINLHTKTENVEISGYVAETVHTSDLYSVFKLQSDKINVSIFANEDVIDSMIKELQKIKRTFKRENTKKVLDTTTK